MGRTTRLALILIFGGLGCDSANHNGGGDNDLSVLQGGDDLATAMGGCGADGTACMAAGQPGLCKTNVCVGCTDGTDDSACGAAYTGTICVGGACVAGCHDSTTCSGKICDPGSGTCQPCTQDQQCTSAATPFCDTTKGTCVATQPACTNGTACGLDGFCCSGVCIPSAECCGGGAAGECTSIPNGVCGTDHHCSSSSLCTDVLDPMKVYVNSTPAANMFGKGTKQCPYKNLSSGIHSVPSPAPAGTTICVTGTFDSTSDKDWPKFLHTNVELDGTYCANDGSHTTLNVAAGNPGVFATDQGPAFIHGFKISQQPASMKTNSGIYVSNTGTGTDTAVQIYDVTINGFLHGIYVGKAMNDTRVGHALIRHDTHANMNGNGLRVDNGAQVEVNVTAAMENMAHAEFNNNDGNGIDVAGGTLTLKGQVFGTDMTALTRTVRADANGGAGLFIAAAGSVTGSYFSASNNTVTQDSMGMITGGYGVNLSSKAHAVFHNSVFELNATNGVRIFGSNGDALAMGDINFGTDANSDPGENHIQGNTQAGICIAFDDSSGALYAKGNHFGNGADCTSTSPSRNLTAAKACSRALDVAGTVGGTAEGKMIYAAHCGFTACNGVTGGACPP